MLLRGMDIEAVSALARHFETAAGQLEALTYSLSDALGRCQWEGADADGFRGDWQGHHRPILLTAGASLRDQCGRLRQQVQEQAEASSAASGTHALSSPYTASPTGASTPPAQGGDVAAPAGSPPGATGQKPSTAEILGRYQVSADPNGTIRYPPAPYNWVVDAKTITRGEADLLDGLSILGKKDFNDTRDAAYEVAPERFASGAEDGHQDAFRHAYWNALMVQRFGRDWAEQMATAHERLPGNPADREAMDLYNNALGRQIAFEHPKATASQLADLVADAVGRGDAVVVAGDGELRYSNEVPEGETGEADDAARDGVQDDGPRRDEGQADGGYDPAGADGGGPRSS